MFVHHHEVLDSSSFRLLRITTQKKAVTDWTSYPIELWFGAKAESWYFFVRIIVHDDLSDCRDGHLVLIGSIRIHIMEGIREFRRSIGSSEVNGHDHAQLCTSPQVIHKGWFLKDFISFENEPPCFLFIRIVKDVCSSNP